MVRHRSPYPRVHSRECSFLQCHPLLQAAAKALVYSIAWLAGANRASPVLTVARREGKEGVDETNLGIRNDAHGSFSGCQ